MPHHSLSPQDAAEDSLVDREAKDLLKQMVVPLVQFIKHQQSSFAEQLQHVKDEQNGRLHALEQQVQELLEERKQKLKRVCDCEDSQFKPVRSKPGMHQQDVSLQQEFILPSEDPENASTQDIYQNAFTLSEKTLDEHHPLNEQCTPLSKRCSKHDAELSISPELPSGPGRSAKFASHQEVEYNTPTGSRQTEDKHILIPETPQPALLTKALHPKKSIPKQTTLSFLDKGNQENHRAARKPETSNATDGGFKFHEVVRDKKKRKQMHASDCPCCEKFYKATIDIVPAGTGNVLADLSTEEARRQWEARYQQRKQMSSRHRSMFPEPSTPEGFWDVGFNEKVKDG